MKKLFLSAFSLLVAMAFAACGNSAGNNGGEQQSDSQQPAAAESSASIETSNWASTVAEKLMVDLNKVAGGSFGANGEIALATPPRYTLTFFFKDKLDVPARTKWLDNFNSQITSAAADGKMYGASDLTTAWDNGNEDMCFPDGEGERFFAKIGEHQFSILVFYGETSIYWTDGKVYPYFDMKIERLDE